MSPMLRSGTQAVPDGYTQSNPCPFPVMSFPNHSALGCGGRRGKISGLCSLGSLGDSGKVTTVVATLGQGPERSQEVAYTDIKVIGNGSFGVVYQARLAETRELVAIKKVLQDKRFKVAWMAGCGHWGACRVCSARELQPGISRS